MPPLPLGNDVDLIELVGVHFVAAIGVQIGVNEFEMLAEIFIFKKTFLAKSFIISWLFSKETLIAKWRAFLSQHNSKNILIL